MMRERDWLRFWKSENRDGKLVTISVLGQRLNRNTDLETPR